MGYGLKSHRKTEGGQGGRRGHSNMSHWEYTEVIKVESKKARRRYGKELVHAALKGVIE